MHSTLVIWLKKHFFILVFGNETNVGLSTSLFQNIKKAFERLWNVRKIEFDKGDRRKNQTKICFHCYCSVTLNSNIFKITHGESQIFAERCPTQFIQFIDIPFHQRNITQPKNQTEILLKIKILFFNVNYLHFPGRSWLMQRNIFFINGNSNQQKFKVEQRWCLLSCFFRTKWNWFYWLSKPIPNYDAVPNKIPWGSDSIMNVKLPLS